MLISQSPTEVELQFHGHLGPVRTRCRYKIDPDKAAEPGHHRNRIRGLPFSPPRTLRPTVRVILPPWKMYPVPTVFQQCCWSPEIRQLISLDE
ncbi:hypothetical protein N7468_001439 [Penicillium chermesinum]|uniref:Uncharacterized protein n=1 Tax=Penicillium chermesinum TaxID=63820 RepID=A0A9W9TWK1_9EURO|nr:uncharacterized protein N7468_001439 [Penicillium chermesinum]KAJ5246456.1 hypothetical protein N7468_001439 [Penicillium chermesinum]